MRPITSRRAAIALAAGATALAAGAARAQASGPAHCITYLEVAPASADEAQGLLRGHAMAARADAANQGFVLLRRVDRPHHFAMVERWRDGAAAEANRTASRTQIFRAALEPALIAPYDERPHTTLSIAGAEAPAGALWAVTHVDIIPPMREVGTERVKQLAEASRGEAGCLRFESLIQDSRPNHFTLVEAWRDERALLGHVQQAHVKAFRGALLPMSGSLYDERLYRQVAV
jgi:quinol monooxygenase YgiN